MCVRCTKRRPRRQRPDAIALRQPTADDVERAETRSAQLEDGWRVRLDVAIDRTDLVPHIAPRVVRETTRRSRAIEPTQTGQTDGARKPSHEKRRVCRARDRREA